MDKQTNIYKFRIHKNNRLEKGEKMETMLEMLSKFGVSLVIVGLFLYDWLTTRKDMQKTLKQNSVCLEEIKNINATNAETNRNTAKSLELLQSSMDTQKEFLFQHDKRCESIEKSIEKINLKMEVSR